MARRKKYASKGAEHFARLTRRMMETPAWKALSPTAQALYPWLKFEFKGPKFNNNGKINLSVRQAAERLESQRIPLLRPSMICRQKALSLKLKWGIWALLGMADLQVTK